MILEPHPTREVFEQLAEQGNLVPVYADLMADFETPVSAYAKLRVWGPAYMLESIEGGERVNRYSFIGCQPRKVIAARLGGETVVTGRDGESARFPTPADPLTLIEDELAQVNPVELPDMPRFAGGAVGFIAYEWVHAIEPTVPVPEDDPVQVPTLHFMLSDTLVIFDRARQIMRLLVNARVEGDPLMAYDAAVRELEGLAERLEQGRSAPALPVVGPERLAVPPSNRSREEVGGMVERAKAYIRAGDCIQVVGSQRFSIDYTGSPLGLYRALRTVNPSPYMFLYDPGPFALVGASPEVHVRLTNGRAELRPIAGTRWRGGTREEDLALEQELLADEKERAEHLMLVDLARNDLGRVCNYGSVTVPEYMIVERYSHVMHIVSQVEGDLANGRNACALMRATFPAGTVSGAPKVRAMQIIAELEKQQRGPYAGVLAYFGYDGNLDSCIAIRTALLKDGKAYVQAGGGWVADSEADYEYNEMVNKASGLLKAFAMAAGMPPAGM